MPGRKRVCIRNLARLQRSTREIPVSFLSRETFVARYAFWFHGLERRYWKEIQSIVGPRSRGDYNTAAMRFQRFDRCSNSCPFLRSTARCGFDLQPTNGITRLRQRLGHNRGQDRGNDATDPSTVPHSRRILSPRKTSKETGSPVIKSISRPVFPFLLSRIDRCSLPSPPPPRIFSFLTSQPFPLRPRGKKENEPLNIENRKEQRGVSFLSIEENFQLHASSYLFFSVHDSRRLLYTTAWMVVRFVRLFLFSQSCQCAET